MPTVVEIMQISAVDALAFHCLKTGPTANIITIFIWHIKSKKLGRLRKSSLFETDMFIMKLRNTYRYYMAHPQSILVKAQEHKDSNTTAAGLSNQIKTCLTESRSSIILC